jgi:hypothetical protein
MDTESTPHEPRSDAVPLPHAGAASEPAGTSHMPSTDAPSCDGTGSTQDARGEDAVCPMGDGTGIFVSDEGDADAE